MLQRSSKMQSENWSLVMESYWCSSKEQFKFISECQKPVLMGREKIEDEDMKIGKNGCHDLLLCFWAFCSLHPNHGMFLLFCICLSSHVHSSCYSPDKWSCSVFCISIVLKLYYLLTLLKTFLFMFSECLVKLLLELRHLCLILSSARARQLSRSWKQVKIEAEPNSSIFNVVKRLTNSLT
jgi:hypothetical protein